MPLSTANKDLVDAAKEVIKQYDDIVLRHGTEGVGELIYAVDKLRRALNEIQKHTESKP